MEDGDGCTAMEYARRYRFGDIVTILEEEMLRRGIEM
jgi:hypothetical protein